MSGLGSLIKDTDHVVKSAVQDESTFSNMAQANLDVLEDGSDDASSVSSGQPCCSIGIASSDEDGNKENIPKPGSNATITTAVKKERKEEPLNVDMKKEDGSKVVYLENPPDANEEKNTINSADNFLKRSLVNIDEEGSYHSAVLADEDRYSPDYIHCMTQEDEDEVIPGMINASNFDPQNSAINISASQEDDMRTMLQGQPDTNHMSDNSVDDPDDDISGSEYTGSTTDDGESLLLNLWNEDYEGNPDPEVMNKLIHANRLPRNLDPYIVNQIERAKVIQELEQYSDDDSSIGDCNVLWNQFFIPRQVMEDDDSDNDSDDSIVDTVINFNTETETEDKSEHIEIVASVSGEATMKFDITELHHNKPKQEQRMYAIPKDNEYRPGMVKNELVLMLPKNDSVDESEDGKTDYKDLLPLQYARGDDSTAKRSKATYHEKEKEFTLRKYDSTPNRIAELVVSGKKCSALDIPSPYSDLSSPGTFEAALELDLVAFRQRRNADDDDPIEEDRSILNPEDIEAAEKAQLEYEEKRARKALAAREAAANKQRSALAQIIGILNNKQSCAVDNSSYSCIESANGKVVDCEIAVTTKDEQPNTEDDILFVEDESNIENIPISSMQDENEDTSIQKLAIMNEDVGTSKPEFNGHVNYEDNMLPDMGEGIDGDFLLDRLPLVASSTSDDSTMPLNPVEGLRFDKVREMEEPKSSFSENTESMEAPSMNDSGSDQVEGENVELQPTQAEDESIELHPTQETDELPEFSCESIDLDEVENKCPNKDNSEEDSILKIKTCPAQDEELPENDELSSIRMVNRGALLTIGDQQSLARENKHTNIDSPKKFVTVGCCNAANPSSHDYDDPNFEELVKLVDAIPSSCSESAGEAEEVVMGVTVEGLRFKPPSGEYGVIIHPEMLEKAMRLAKNAPGEFILIEDQPEDTNINLSQSSEYYANMILDVTNDDESTAQSDYVTKEEGKPNAEDDISSAADKGMREVLDLDGNHGSGEPCDEKEPNLNDSARGAEITTDLSNMDYYHKIKSEVSIPDISFGEMDIEVTDARLMQSTVEEDITDAQTDIMSNVYRDMKVAAVTDLESVVLPNSEKEPQSSSLFRFSSVNALWN